MELATVVTAVEVSDGHRGPRLPPCSSCLWLQVIHREYGLHLVSRPHRWELMCGEFRRSRSRSMMESSCSSASASAV